MRYTPNGNAVSSFSVATNRRYRTSDGENREETEWFRVSAWGRLAEVANQYLTKGSPVYVEGRFSTSRWTGRDGEERTSSEIFATEVVFLSGRDGEGSGGYGGSQPRDDFGGPQDPDDLPF